MKKRIASVVCVVMLATLVFGAVPVWADNTVASSTMIFEGTLTDEGGGVYSGVLAMVDEAVGPLGDGVSGYDVYARNGATAQFGNDPGSGPVWTPVAIGTSPNDHDAWPAWTTDTPDWYQYSLNLYQVSGEYKWAVRNHAGATVANPWDDEVFWGVGGLIARGVPMSGAMNWTNDYACETDTGAYLSGTGTPEILGGAATKGGGAACWDMDWSWGSEVVPLEFPGFDVAVAAQGGGIYRVTLTPAEAPVKNLDTGETFCTIQAAIDDANTLDTHVIEVANGTYTEQVSISSTSAKGVTIQGESESGVIVQANSGGPVAGENTFTINAAGKDVTIKTITIRHGDYGIRSRAGNVDVLNCTLYHNGWDGMNLPDPDTDPQSAFVTFFATYATDGGAMRIENSAGSEIAHCTVYENVRAIRLQDSDNGDIHDNKSYNNLESGIYLSASTYTGATGCTNTVVYDNESYGNMNNGLLSIGGYANTLRDNDVHDNWNTGVMLWHPSEITVEHNTIVHNNLYDFNGVGNGGDDEAGGVWVAGDTNVTSRGFAVKILKNTISDNQKGGVAKKEGVRINSAVISDGIEIKHNAFTLQEIDVHVLGQAGTVKVNYNSFAGADIGVQNDDTVIVDAENNWWGDASGPEDLLGSDEASPGTCFDPSTMKNADGNGDGVSDLYVDYCPWLACPAALWVEPVEEAYLIDDTFDVVINVRSVEPAYGAQVTFTYDPGKLAIQSHTVGDFGGSGPQVVFNEDPAGTVLIGVSRISPETHFLGEGVLMTINFKAIGAGDSGLQLSSAILADSDAIQIAPVCLDDGLIHVLGAGTGVMAGTVELQGRPGDWDGAAITLTHEDWPKYTYTMNVTNLDGTWSQANMAPGNYTVEVEMARYLDAVKAGVGVTDGSTTTLSQVKLLGGDAVADDEVNVLDLTLIGGQFGKSPPDSGFEDADINDDNVVNILDLVLAGGNYTKTSPVPWP